MSFNWQRQKKKSQKKNWVQKFQQQKKYILPKHPDKDFGKYLFIYFSNFEKTVHSKKTENLLDFNINKNISAHT